MSISNFCPFFSKFFFLLLIYLYLYIIWISSPYQIYNSQIFSPIKQDGFSFVGGLVRYAEAFYFYVVQLVYFCFSCVCFGGQIQKFHINTNVKELTAYFSSKSFMVSGLTSKSLIHFELIYAYGVR